MYFFRTFKKSTAPYKVHNMGLRYIKFPIACLNLLYNRFGVKLSVIFAYMALLFP